jgi:nicotinate-nucleotide adenylyltransferase
MRRRRIGILGGSFNPAHDGHRDISMAALKNLGLDQVWWMVSPQNPLKDTKGMAPFKERLERARRVSDHPRIRVTDIETLLGTRFTAQTLSRLVARHPDCRFVWLMGADNLAQIFQLLPIAVFDRPTYTYRALAATAARQFARVRVPEFALGALVRKTAPAWAFVHHRLNPISATAIRARRSGTSNQVRRVADALGKEGDNHSTHA